MPQPERFMQLNRIFRKNIPSYKQHTKESLYVLYWLNYTCWPVESPLPVQCELARYMGVSEDIIQRGLIRLLKLKHLVKVKPFRCWRTYLNPSLNWDKARSILSFHHSSFQTFKDADLIDFIKTHCVDRFDKTLFDSET